MGCLHVQQKPKREIYGGILRFSASRFHSLQFSPGPKPSIPPFSSAQPSAGTAIHPLSSKFAAASSKMMDGDMSDDGEIYIHDADTIHEITLDDEDLPDVNDEDDEQADFDEDLDDSMHTFTGHTSELYAVACSPTDPLLVATGGGDDRGFLWKIGQGDWAAEMGGHKDTVTSLAFSSDGQFLASGGLDSVVNVWDTSGNHKCTLEGPAVSEQTEEHADGFEWVRWHPRGHLVLAGSNDGTAWMWNADRGAVLQVFPGHSKPVTCGDFTPDGKTVCTGSDDMSLRIWNPRTGESVYVIKGHPYHTARLNCLAISSDSTLVLTGSEDGSVKIVNIVTGKVVSTLSRHTDSVSCIALSRSSSFPWAATGGRDQQLVIWDLERSDARNICNHESEVTCLTWIGMTRYVAAGCGDGDVVIWDGRSGDKVKTFKGHSSCVQSLAVSSNHDFLATASDDGTARIFEIGEFK
ncbi:unnamed protein product [Linum tenue]|uniref:Angio-associated migratory cell protein n=1 Tax=Linum tenue TaxID=586396 RepID=A0AAV0NRM4_9ROSI|nr:unnamed protein product [Linum tenue]